MCIPTMTLVIKPSSGLSSPTLTFLCMSPYLSHTQSSYIMPLPTMEGNVGKALGLEGRPPTGPSTQSPCRRCPAIVSMQPLCCPWEWWDRGQFGWAPLTSAPWLPSSTEPHRRGPPAAGLRGSAAVCRSLVSTRPLGSFPGCIHLPTPVAQMPYSQPRPGPCMGWGEWVAGYSGEEGRAVLAEMPPSPNSTPPPYLGCLPLSGLLAFSAVFLAWQGALVVVGWAEPQMR